MIDDSDGGPDCYSMNHKVTSFPIEIPFDVLYLHSVSTPELLALGVERGPQEVMCSELLPLVRGGVS